MDDQFLPNLKAEDTNPNQKPPSNPLPSSSSSNRKRDQVAAASSSPAKRRKKEESVDDAAETRKKEQAAAVRDIKRNKNYYAILGIKNTSTAEDIRKAYKKLSLKVHPDKNPEPGAEDSFKKLLEAFECLSNYESRSKYDLQTSPPASVSVSVSRRSSKVSVSVSVPRRRRSRVEVIKEVVIHLIFRVGAFMLYLFDLPLTMKELMRVARSKVEFFKLSGSFRLKYEYGGKIIYLPKEDELGADNELRTCIHRWLSVGVEPVIIRAEFI